MVKKQMNDATYNCLLKKYRKTAFCSDEQKAAAVENRQFPQRAYQSYYIDN